MLDKIVKIVYNYIMAIVNTLRIYEILKPAFQDAQAKVIADVIEKSHEESQEYQKVSLATNRILLNLR